MEGRALSLWGLPWGSPCARFRGVSRRSGQRSQSGGCERLVAESCRAGARGNSPRAALREAQKWETKTVRPRRRPRKTPARSASGPADGSRARQGRDDFGSEPKYPSCRSRSVPGRRLDALENSSAKSNVTRCTRFARVLSVVASDKRRQIRAKQRRTTARAPHRSPFPHRTSHKQARRITMRVHAGRRLPTPQMISNKLLTALALLAQHAAALDGVSGTTSRRLDDLCAPASTSAARRARRAARVPPSHVGLRRRRRRPRPRRRRPRRPCRAGALPASKLNDSFKTRDIAN